MFGEGEIIGETKNLFLGFKDFIEKVKQILKSQGTVRKVFFQNPKGFDELIPKLNLETAFLTLYLGKTATLAKEGVHDYMVFLEDQNQELYILDYPEAKLRPNRLQHLYNVLQSLVDKDKHLIVLTNDIQVKNIIEKKETN